MTLLGIATVSRLLAVPVPTLRSWERRYGVPAPPRTVGGHRRYSAAEVELLREMRDEIARGRPAREAAAVVIRRARDGGGSVDELLVAVSTLDPGRIRLVLDRAAEADGVEATVTALLLPALRTSGRLWEAGGGDVAHEHLFTTTAREWLTRQAALAPPPFRPAPLVLAAAPDDLHTLGLEAFATLLARRGWSCRVLGARTPSASVALAARAVRACGVVVSAQRSTVRRGAVQTLEVVDRMTGVRAFFAGGGFGTANARRGVPGIYLGEDMVAATHLLEAQLMSLTLSAGARAR